MHHLRTLALQAVMIILLLEVGLRVLAGLQGLPPRLQTSARHVVGGDAPVTGIYQYLMTDISHQFALLPDLQSVRVEIGTEAHFNFSTISLWNSRYGIRNRYVDYKVEAVFVGDSFTFCFTDGVDCWVRRFERESGLGSVNLGIPGTASVSHLNMLKQFATPLRPRLVIWQFFGNDFNEDYGFAVTRGELERHTTPYEIPVPPLLSRGVVVDTLRDTSVLFAVLDTLLGNDIAYLPDYQRLFVPPYVAEYGEHRLLFGQGYELAVMDLDNPNNRAGIPYTRQALIEAQALIESWGGTLIVVLMPTREQAYEHVTTPPLGERMGIYDQPYSTMLALCEELDVLCADPLPTFKQYAVSNEHLYYTDDMHLNPRGNDVLAQFLIEWLGQRQLLYPPQ